MVGKQIGPLDTCNACCLTSRKLLLGTPLNTPLNAAPVEPCFFFHFLVMIKSLGNQKVINIISSKVRLFLYKGHRFSTSRFQTGAFASVCHSKIALPPPPPFGTHTHTHTPYTPENPKQAWFDSPAGYVIWPRFSVRVSDGFRWSAWYGKPRCGLWLPSFPRLTLKDFEMEA